MPRGKIPNDLTNLVFGKLIARKLVSFSRNGHAKWLCECVCGNEKIIFGTHLTQGNTTHCGCIKRPIPRNWTGFGEISGSYWSSCQRGSKGNKRRRAIDFSITIEYAWNLFLQQERKCKLSGIELKFDGVSSKQTASLDRIDSSRGYVEGNVQWLHKDVNRMKNAFDEKYFVELCNRISSTN